jgi:hypothetical protein
LEEYGISDDVNFSVQNIHSGRMKYVFIAIIRSDMEIDHKRPYKLCVVLFFSVKKYDYDGAEV